MKTLIALIFIVLSTLVYAQPDRQWVVTNSDAGTLYRYQVSGLDSGATGHSVAFDSRPILAYYMSGNVVDTSAPTSSVGRYLFKPYATVSFVTPSTVDSLSLLTISGNSLAGSWVVVDTLRTKQETSIYTPIIIWSGIPYFTEWRVDWAVADITKSSYSGILYVEIFVPKVRNN